VVRGERNNDKEHDMKAKTLLVATAAIGLLTLAHAGAQNATSRQMTSGDQTGAAGKRIRITYENLTTGQTFSPSVFVTHNASAPPLFKDGEKASFGLMRIAEEGNAGPFLSAEVVKKIGGPFGTAVQAISVAPGSKRSVDIEVTQSHPDAFGRVDAGDDQ
jgi:hypothetical protein